MTGSYLDLNGAKIYYEEQGSGIPIVLVHGGLTSSARWAPTVPSLADAFRVITPDSRGHGNSDNPSGDLSYPQLADDVAALIAELGLVRPIVGGYSDGGQVTLEFGVRHWGVARGLVVGAAYPTSPAAGFGTLTRRSSAPTPRATPTSASSTRTWALTLPPRDPAIRAARPSGGPWSNNRHACGSTTPG